MRTALCLLFVFAIGYGTWWAQSHDEDTLLEFFQQRLKGGEFTSLEARYSAEQIMNSQEKHLLPSSEHGFFSPSVEFAPFAHLKVSYHLEGQPRMEGEMLWNMQTGKLVLNAQSWEEETPAQGSQEGALKQIPLTGLTHWLAFQPYKHAHRIAAKYSLSDIQTLAKRAGGPNLSIESKQRVYLPVYSLTVQNPDGTISRSLWNGVTGQRYHSPPETG